MFSSGRPGPARGECLDSGKGLGLHRSPRGHPQGPASCTRNTRGCCSEGEAQEQASELLFLNPSSYLPGILEGSFSSVALPPAGRGVAPLPSADPLCSGRRGAFLGTMPASGPRGLGRTRAFSRLWPSRGLLSATFPAGLVTFIPGYCRLPRFPQRAGSHGFNVIMKVLSENTSIS